MNPTQTDDREDRYAVVSPFESQKSTGYVIEDRQKRARITAVWKDGPGGMPAERIAVRLAGWLNRLAAVEAENQQLRRAEES